jgi:polysaccharide export outer membrane protein
VLKIRQIPLLLTCVFVLMLGSCSINPSIMFKDGNTVQLSYDSSLVDSVYRIAPSDLISVEVFSEGGIRLVEQPSLINPYNSSQANYTGSTTPQEYLVDESGNVKLPLIGQIQLKGKSIREAEKSIEQRFTEFYNDPFVILKVLNRRVMVFPGTGGSGKVVELKNEKTTLIEVLAAAGGLTSTGKSKTIKIIRGDFRNPKIIRVNLQTLDAARNSDIRILANDIIYVEPVPRISQEVLVQLAPIVGIVTSLALLYQIANGIK